MKVWNQKIVFILLLTIFFMESFISVFFKSPAYDELLWLVEATRIVARFDWTTTLSLLNPPLPYYIFGLPHAILLKFFRPHSPFPWRLFGNTLVIYPIDIHFMVARLPVIILGIILGVYVYRWAKELFGINAGLGALFIYTFSPNILAHTRLVTHDSTVTCFIFVAVYYLWRFSRLPTSKNLILSGITLGFALLSKYTGILLIPIYFLIAGCLLMNRKEEVHFKAKDFSGSSDRKISFPITVPVALALVFLIAGFIVWAGYGFQFQKLIEFPTGARYGISIPAGAYINGIRLSLYHTEVLPRRFFLMGAVSPNTWWYFYVVGLAGKVPVAVIVLFCLSVLGFPKRGFLNLADGCFLVLPPLLIFLYFSFFSPMNRGLRYILPVFPFVFVFIGGAVSQQAKSRSMKIIIILLGLWYVVSSIQVFPHYLSYFNQFAGGPDSGYKYLVDSDLDWGQDLKGLKSYMEKKNIDKIKLDYFGSVNPESYQINYEKFESLPASGYVAVSATNLQNVYSDTPDYSYLRTLRPVDKIGYSIFIYNFGNEQ